MKSATGSRAKAWVGQEPAAGGGRCPRVSMQASLDPRPTNKTVVQNMVSPAPTEVGRDRAVRKPKRAARLIDHPNPVGQLVKILGQGAQLERLTGTLQALGDGDAEAGIEQVRELMSSGLIDWRRVSKGMELGHVAARVRYSQALVGKTIDDALIAEVSAQTADPPTIAARWSERKGEMVTEGMASAMAEAKIPSVEATRQQIEWALRLTGLQTVPEVERAFGLLAAKTSQGLEGELSKLLQAPEEGLELLFEDAEVRHAVIAQLDDTERLELFAENLLVRIERLHGWRALFH